ncbi:MAG: metal-dependent hydrolase [Planctomycetota bacterium]|nr:MAG: metal-dependent hydrolase [Planctomycetota bacterium]
MQITWHGHATWLIEHDGHRVLIDPFFNENPAAIVKAKEVRADTILVTHGHFDHIADAASIAQQSEATVVANFEIATWLSNEHGVKSTVGMNLGGWTTLPFGRVQMTIAFHSSQLPDGAYGGNPGGYLIEIGGKRLYVAGDTALFSDMQLYGRTELDAAILPIGDLFTMGPVDSLHAIYWLRPRVVFPSHYNTWPPIAQDVESWADAVRQQGVAEPRVPEVGVAIELE